MFELCKTWRSVHVLNRNNEGTCEEAQRVSCKFSPGTVCGTDLLTYCSATQRPAVFQQRAEDIGSADQIGHSSITRSIVQILDGVLLSSTELRQFLLWKDGLWMSCTHQPSLRPATIDLLSCFPPLSDTQALVTIFLERVNPHAWVLSDEEIKSIVDKLYKDSSGAHIWELCSLLLSLSIATHYQTPATTAHISIDNHWQHTISFYLDEILSRATQNPLWATRIFVLLTLNGMGARKNSCWHYHGALIVMWQFVILIRPTLSLADKF